MLKLTNLQSSNVELISEDKLAAVKGGTVTIDNPLTPFPWVQKPGLSNPIWTPKSRGGSPLEWLARQKELKNL